MGGLGGLMLGGLLGSMLFGGGGGVGSAGMGGGLGGGIGLLEILLIGGLIWFGFRWIRKKKEEQRPRTATGPDFQRNVLEGKFRREPTMAPGTPLPNTFSVQGESDEVTQGIERIAVMDHQFDERVFLEGAKHAFEQIQGAWSDWSVDRLQYLLTDRMWGMIQTQAQESRAAGRRDIIEKIRFEAAEVSEAWQESGEDWITVRFAVEMVDYVTDVDGKTLEGDPDKPVQVEEFWSFVRPVGSDDPNWRLAAIQQPGEVARGSV